MKTTKGRVFRIDREINDTDIWLVSIVGKKRRYIGGKTGLKQAFDKDVDNYVCTVVMRFIDKRSDLVEKYINKFSVKNAINNIFVNANLVYELYDLTAYRMNEEKENKND